jgi:hypothetical protein
MALRSLYPVAISCVVNATAFGLSGCVDTRALSEQERNSRFEEIDGERFRLSR